MQECKKEVGGHRVQSCSGQEVHVEILFGMLSVLSPDIHTCEDSHLPMAPLFQGDPEPHKIFSDVISLQNVVWKIISTPKKPIMGHIPELHKSSVNS